MKYAERILAVSALVSLVGKSAMVKGSVFFLALSLTLLSLIYLLFSFLLLNNIRFRSIFKAAAYAHASAYTIVASVFCGLCYAVALQAFLFCVMRWPGGALMSAPALVLAFAALAVAAMFYRKESLCSKGLLIRSLTMLVLCVSVSYIHRLPVEAINKIFPVDSASWKKSDSNLPTTVARSGTGSRSRVVTLATPSRHSA